MDPYVGEIRMFGGRFAPQGWQFCDGSLLSVSNYQVLFSLLGNIWGGDGVNNFGVPDLRCRIPVGQGQGTNLSMRTLAQKGGTETVTLATANLPLHTHTFNASTSNATATVPGPALTFGAASYTTSTGYTPKMYTAYLSTNTTVTLDADTITMSGNGGAHDDVMPSTVINFIIATNGIYPQRS